jgi:hypothetical protein
VWRVTWAKEYTIDKVVIYNRRDCCQDRLIGATIHVNGELVATVPRAEDLTRFEFPDLNKTTKQVEIRGKEGNSTAEALSLAEVEVFVVEDNSS